VPIVPLRFAGGLPLAPVAEPLAFPVGYGKQDFWIGTPILPQAFASLPSAARKEAVLAALNGVWRALAGRITNAGDVAFCGSGDGMAAGTRCERSAGRAMVYA